MKHLALAFAICGGLVADVGHAGDGAISEREAGRVNALIEAAPPANLHGSFNRLQD